MICSLSGLVLTKAELSALLAFSAKTSDERPHLSVVHFLVEDDRCWAYATDGHRAVECDGESDAKLPNGEWLVAREFLDAANKLLGAEQSIRLCFSRASLTEAVVEDKEGLQLSTFQWPRDAASSQQTFPQVRDVIKIPQHSNPVRVVTLNPAYIADLKKVAAAAEKEAIDLYPPESPLSPLFFRVETDPTTTWTGAIMPLRSTAAEVA